MIRTALYLVILYSIFQKPLQLYHLYGIIFAVNSDRQGVGKSPLFTFEIG